MSGLTSFSKSEVLAKISELKHLRFGEVTIDCRFNNFDYTLLLLTSDCSEDQSLMELIGRWRQENENWFQAIFKVTLEGTTKWFKNNLINAPDRLLFIIKIGNEYIGHVGLFRFNFEKLTCEIDNIVRGEPSYPGVMGDAIISMMSWGKEILGLKGYTLQTFYENERAVKLYKKLGFVGVKRDPLVKVVSKDRIEWLPAPKNFTGRPLRHNYIMELLNENQK